MMKKRRFLQRQFHNGILEKYHLRVNVNIEKRNTT